MTDDIPARDRRGFLKTSLLVGAVGVATTAVSARANGAAKAKGKEPAPTANQARAESPQVPGETSMDTEAGPQVANPGSDIMCDLLREAGIDYVAAMPGSTFRGLHESILNHGGNSRPELITCVHEEISAAMAHGYAKVAGKPMACMVHSNVGLQHASMAIYNAWCDRVPMIVIIGNALDAATRRPWIEWLHSQSDVAAMVRDYTKWDDIPISLQHYAESFMRGYEISMTPPYGPVAIVCDTDLQEHPVADPSAISLPKRAPVSAPAGESGAIEKAAKWLVAAEYPLILADRVARTADAVPLLVELAEMLQAPVVERFGRFNLPNNHYLNQTFRQGPLVTGSDTILGLEMTDLFGVLNVMRDLPERNARSITKPDAKVIAISANYGFTKANVQDMQRYRAADLTLDADAQTCLPQLIASVRRQLTPERRQAIAAREPMLRAAHHDMRAKAAADAALSWEASPIGTGRLCMEVYDIIKDLDWALVSSAGFASFWPQRLWDIERHHQYIGADGGYGVGYGAPAAAGAAMAHRDAGRIPVAIQSDGDMMVLPGTLWTLAHHHIPLLTVMQNNRAYHQETMHIQRMAGRRNRGAERAPIGTLLTEPNIDFAAMARSMGVWAEGPIDKPAKLRPALQRALKVVQSGKPALVDVITQPR